MPPKVGAPTGRTAAASKLSVPKAAAGAKIAAAASSSKSAAKGGGTRGDASKGGGPKTKATTTTSSAAVEKIPAAAAEIAPSSPPSKAGSAQDDAGEMKWQDIDDEYCISFVFPGNFSVCLSTGDSVTLPRGQDGKFRGLEDGAKYTLIVQEDAATAAAAAAAAKAAADRIRAIREEEEKKTALSKGKVDDITQQLKNLKAEDRTGHGSEEFRRLKEARDLEDCLFSSGRMH